MYVVDSVSKNVFQYTLLTGWDLSTASYADKSHTFSGTEIPTGLAFSADGSYIYIADYENSNFRQYQLSVPWDVSTAGESNIYGLGAMSADSHAYGIYFNPSGTQLFFVGSQTNKIHQYNLTTPWEINSAIYIGGFSFSNQTMSAPFGLSFSNNLSKLYLVSNGLIYQYNVMFGGGAGASINPYQVTTCMQLQNMRNDNYAQYNYYYQLENNIDCQTDTHEGGELWNNGTGFGPIGWYYYDAPNSTFISHAFTGYFNGQGYTISNLYIDHSDASDPGDRGTYIGLFGYSPALHIQNFKMTNVEITGANYVGGALGILMGDSSISDVSVQGEVHGNNTVGLVIGDLEIIGSSYIDGFQVSGVSANGDVYGEQYVGGVVGNVYGTAKIKNSYSQVTLHATNTDPRYFGGLAGRVQEYSFWYNPYYYSFPQLSPIIQNAYSVVSFTKPEGAGFAYVGGLMGEYIAGNLGGSITNSFATGTMPSGVYIGGLIGGINCRSYPDTLPLEQRTCAPVSGFTLASNYWSESSGASSGIGVTLVPGVNTDEQYNVSSVEDSSIWQGSCTSIAPMSVWDFSRIWQTVGDDYPDLNYSVTTADAPTGLTVSGYTANSVSLSWTAPLFTGRTSITAYTFKYRITGSEGSWSSQSTYSNSTYADVSGLQPNTSYDFAVLTENSQGLSAPSSTVNQSTSEYSITGNSIEEEPSSATIYWDANFNADSYNINYGTTLEYGTTSTSYNCGEGCYAQLVGLTPSTTYYFQVVASIGGLEYSYTGDFTTLDCSISGTSYEVSGTIAEVYWSINATPNNQTFQYGITTDYGSAEEVLSGEGYYVNLSGLSPNTIYYYKITANLGGEVEVTNTGSFTTTEAAEIAIDVFGQVDEGGNIDFEASDSRADNYGFYQPSGVAIDTVHHRLFVADGVYNDRVVIFNLNNDNTPIDYEADVILTNVNDGENYLDSPRNVFFDSQNSRLFISNSGSDQIVVLDASGEIVNGMNSSYILSSADTYYPLGMVIDNTGGRLFVASNGYARGGPGNIEVYDIRPASSSEKTMCGIMTTGIGSNSGEPSCLLKLSGTPSPRDVAYDDTNSILYVTYPQQNRVIVFDARESGSSEKTLCGVTTTGFPADNITNATPSCVLGQPNLETMDEYEPSVNTFYKPRGLSFDNDEGRLFVTDMYRHRVLEFDNIYSDLQNNMDASGVFGQSGFENNNCNTSQEGLCYPNAVAFDQGSGRLYVSDQYNNRIMVFDASIENTCPTVSNTATYNAYPTCGPATCDSGYTVSNNICVQTVTDETCPTISHVARYNPYPACGIATCETGYHLSNDVCVASIGGGGGSYYILPKTDQTLIEQLRAKIAILQAQVAVMLGTKVRVDSQGSYSGFSFAKRLSLGMIDNDVKYLQMILNSDKDTQVNISGIGSKGLETTKFGFATYNAVKKFQKKYSSEILDPQGFSDPTGIVATLTIKKLNSIIFLLSQ